MLSSLALLCVLLAVVSDSRTINWNNGGGTNEWFNVANWDCQCVPTAADDVVINSSRTSTVLIGGQNFPALAKTLTIGGNSGASQVLIVTGALTVVSGGALNANGKIHLESGQNTPFINNGTFTVHATAGFIFATGTLAGTGTFIFPPKTLLNFSNPAAKTIATNVQVDGTAQVSSATGSTLSIAKGGGFVINGVLKSQTSLTITVDPSATFGVVKGTFVFSGQTLNIQGTSSIFSWNIDAASVVTLDHPITSSNLNLAGTIRLTGAPATGRSFTTVTGTGTIISEGGTNTFGTVQANSLVANGGIVTISTSANVNSFSIIGAEVRGAAKLTTSSATLSSGTLSQGITLAVSSQLTISGTVGLDGRGTSIVTGPNSKAYITGNSQLTMGDGTIFSTSSTLVQSGNLKLVGTNSSVVNNYASWTVNGSLTIFNLYTSGGDWKVASTGSVQLTSNVFNVKTIANDGSVVFTTSTFQGTVTGKGKWSGFPTSFYAPQLSTGEFTLTNGLVKIDNGSIGTFNVQGGRFNLGQKVQVTELDFSVGIIDGGGIQQSVLSVGTFIISGSVVTLKNIQVNVSSKLRLTCGNNCQLLTDHAVVTVL